MTEDERRMLYIAVEDLNDYAALLSPHGDTGVIQLARDVRKLADREA